LTTKDILVWTVVILAVWLLAGCAVLDFFRFGGGDDDDDE
jgi:hypothetical protein